MALLTWWITCGITPGSPGWGSSTGQDSSSSFPVMFILEQWVHLDSSCCPGPSASHLGGGEWYPLPPNEVCPPAPGILNMEHPFLGRLLSGLSSSLSSKWLSFLHRTFRLSYSSVNSWIVSELEFYPPLSLVLSRHCSAVVLLRITWLVVTVFLQSHLHLLSEAPCRHTVSADSFLRTRGSHDQGRVRSGGEKTRWEE